MFSNQNYFVSYESSFEYCLNINFVWESLRHLYYQNIFFCKIPFTLPNTNFNVNTWIAPEVTIDQCYIFASFTCLFKNINIYRVFCLKH